MVRNISDNIQRFKPFQKCDFSKIERIGGSSSMNFNIPLLKVTLV